MFQPAKESDHMLNKTKVMVQERRAPDVRYLHQAVRLQCACKV